MFSASLWCAPSTEPAAHSRGPGEGVWGACLALPAGHLEGGTEHVLFARMMRFSLLNVQDPSDCDGTRVLRASSACPSHRKHPFQVPAWVAASWHWVNVSPGCACKLHALWGPCCLLLKLFGDLCAQRCGNKFLGSNQFEKTGEYFCGSYMQAILRWVGFLGGSVEPSITAGTQGCAVSPGEGAWGRVRRCRSGWVGPAEATVCPVEPRGPALPGSSCGTGCARPRPSPATHTHGYAHTRIHTHRYT